MERNQTQHSVVHTQTRELQHVQINETFRHVPSKTPTVGKATRPIARLDSDRNMNWNGGAEKQLEFLSTAQTTAMLVRTETFDHRESLSYYNATETLVQDTLAADFKDVLRNEESYNATKEKVAPLIACVVKFTVNSNDTARNAQGSVCYSDLTHLLKGVSSTTLHELANEYLPCNGGHNHTDPETAAMIDVLATIGTPHAQDLLVSHILRTPEPNEQYLMRTFVHCINIQHPTMALVEAVHTQV